MAHFAKVGDGNVVTKVIVAEQEFIDNINDTEPGLWVQCSYNTRDGVHYLPDSDTPSEDQSKALRQNFPGIGWLYDSEGDSFYMPQPFPSWTLNKTTWKWEAPVEEPDDGNRYDWDEESQSWVEHISAE